MLILNKNYRQGFVQIRVSLLDDLWYLSHVIEEGDLLTAKTERKIKLGDAQEGRTQVVKKTITLQIQIVSTELEQGAVLRCKGTVAKALDDIPLGAHHSISLGMHDEFTLQKKNWSSHIIEKLEDAANNTAQSVLVVLFDRDDALFSEVTQQGIKHIASLKPEVQQKQYTSSGSGTVIDALLAQVREEFSRKDYASIVFASPGFWHAPLSQKLDVNLKKKSILVTAHAVDKGLVNKLLSRPELKSALASHRLRKEQQLIELVQENLAKETLVYGFEDVGAAVDLGAVAMVVVSDTFYQTTKEKDLFEALDTLLQNADAAQGKVHVVYDEQVSRFIDGLGGIVASTRWKL